MKNGKYIIYTLICGVLISCNKNPDGSISLQPASLDLNPPPGPPIYQKAWSEGCESGANAYSNPFYKQIGAFQYKYDTSLRNNEMYSKAWKDAFVYCSIYWERTNGEPL